MMEPLTIGAALVGCVMNKVSPALALALTPTLAPTLTRRTCRLRDEQGLPCSSPTPNTNPSPNPNSSHL